MVNVYLYVSVIDKSARLHKMCVCRFRNKVDDFLTEIIFNFMLAGTGCVCSLLYQFHAVSTITNMIPFVLC